MNRLLKRLHVALVLTIVLTVLSCSPLVGVQFVRLAEANFFPLPTPLPAFFIRSDGSVDPSTAPIQRVVDVYTFTDNIVGYTIVVERDNIVIDGGGYTLQGNGNSTGIFLQGRSNVVVRNMEIRDFSIGITLYAIPGWNSRDNTISGNTITNNTYGIGISFGGSNVVSGNIIRDNGCGVRINHSPNNTFRNNQLTNNKYNLWISCETAVQMTYYINDIDNSNTVNGKPVIYWVNEKDKTVPSDAGFVALVNCTNITVQNLSLSNNGQGILLVSTTNAALTKNHLTNNGHGIVLFGPYEACTYNRIVENNITENGRDGIHQWGGHNGNITKNHITNNQESGISSFDSRNNIMSGNSIVANNDYGIKLWFDSNKNTISENYIASNEKGILVDGSVDSKIFGNTVTENNGWGIELDGASNNNMIYHNNFVNNKVEDGLQVSVPGEILGSTYGNVWDNGEEGNYWSDYVIRYPNATEIDGTGIGNTPFYINENNIDRYPLMDHFIIPEFPTWTPIILTLTVFALALVINKQKLRNSKT